MNLEIISRQDFTLTKDLAYLFGVYLTDGSITECNFQLQAIDKDFVGKTLNLWKRFVKTKSLLRERLDTGGWNKQKRYVVKIGIGKYARWFRDETNGKHHLPYGIWDTQDGVKKSFIAGVMDGDGWISKTKRKNSPCYQYRIGVGGVADGWIYEFRELLISQGVKCNKIERFRTKNGRWFCRFNINPKSFFDSKLYFTIERKVKRCEIASETTR